MLKNNAKFHISIGHELSMGKCTFFRIAGDAPSRTIDEISNNSDFEWIDHVPDASECCDFMVFVDFATPVMCTSNALMIAARLDADVNAKTCRLAFHGRLVVPVTAKELSANVLSRVRVFKQKERSGVVERQHDESTLIVTGLFKKETNLDLFVNMKIELSTGEKGVIEGGFGSSGKVRIRIMDPFTQEAMDVLDTLAATKKNRKVATAGDKQLKAILRFRKYLYAGGNKMIQSLFF